MEINSTIKNRFVKDNSFNIPTVQSPYFEYFLDLYEEEYKTKSKFIQFKKILEYFDGEENYLDFMAKLNEYIINKIKNSEEYELLNSYDLSDFKTSLKIQKQNLYIEENDNKNFISIDMIKANYSVFNFLSKDLNNKDSIFTNDFDTFLKEQTEDFLKIYEYSNEQINNLIEYISSLKQLRQVIFGNINPKRQQAIQLAITNNLANTILEKINNLTVINTTSDEILIKPNENKNIIELQNQINSLINKLNLNIFRVESFTLNKIKYLKSDNGYIKNFIKPNKNKEFKAVPSFLFAQVYKIENNIELNDYDKVFWYEGQVAFFDKFINEISLKKNKLKL